MQSGGDCFWSAGRFILDMRCDDGSYMLVHGRPTLTVAPYEKYDHAWVEINDVWVLDTESRSSFLREKYYEVGRIEPRECRYYTKKQVARIVLSVGHWGPWEGEARQEESDGMQGLLG